MNNNFNFNVWFDTVIPTADVLVQNEVHHWLVVNEFNTFEALRGLEERHMPENWPAGRKRAIYASRPGIIAQGNHP